MTCLIVQSASVRMWYINRPNCVAYFSSVMDDYTCGGCVDSNHSPAVVYLRLPPLSGGRGG